MKKFALILVCLFFVSSLFATEKQNYKYSIDKLLLISADYEIDDFTRKEINKLITILRTRIQNQEKISEENISPLEEIQKLKEKIQELENRIKILQECLDRFMKIFMEIGVKKEK